MPTTTAPSTLGPVSFDETYDLGTFKRLSGLSDWALRMARRKGLKIRKVGKRKYVVGRDWAEFLTTVDG
jgi:hypothetical protein